MCQNEENNVGFQLPQVEQFVPPKKETAEHSPTQKEGKSPETQFTDEMSITEYEIAYYGE